MANFRYGQAVKRESDGALGIVTDPWARKSGIFKGKIFVAFIGGPYGETTADPEELTRVELVEKPKD